MLPDSMNIGIIAENIKKLFSMFSGQDSRISDLETAAERIPKDYSTTETGTGVKWIDGKEIYRKVFSATTLSEAGNQTIGSIDEVDNVVLLQSVVVRSDNNKVDGNSPLTLRVTQSKNVLITIPSNNVYYEATITAIVYYTKPAPTPDVVPAPGNDTRSVEPIKEVTEEPVQETKTTRKRSTSSK